jgi:hypothetical protein
MIDAAYAQWYDDDCVNEQGDRPVGRPAIWNGEAVRFVASAQLSRHAMRWVLPFVLFAFTMPGCVCRHGCCDPEPLLAQLAMVTERDQRLAILRKLTLIDDSRVEHALAPHLSTDTSEEAYYVVAYLAERGNPKALEVLNWNYFEYDVSSAQRAWAAETFGNQKYIPGATNLLQSLDAASWNLAGAAFSSLGEMFPGTPEWVQTPEDAIKYYTPLVKAMGAAALPPGLGGMAVAPIVSGSAEGWSLKPGIPIGALPRPTTIVINPRGQAFSIGETAYPDILPATLWIVETTTLPGRFLIIHVPPVASGSVSMPVLFVDSEDNVTLAGTIQQRFEFRADPNDRRSSDPVVESDGWHHLKDFLFKDVNNDGIVELVEDDVWKDDGTITYYRFREDHRFEPIIREYWVRNAGTERMNLISTERIGSKGP